MIKASLQGSGTFNGQNDSLVCIDSSDCVAFAMPVPQNPAEVGAGTLQTQSLLVEANPSSRVGETLQAQSLLDNAIIGQQLPDHSF